MTEAYKLFWESVKATSIVFTPSKVCILYATNPETLKHYGVHAAYPYGHTQEELVKRYGVPGRPVKVYMLHQSGAYEKFIYRKDTKVMQVPLEGLCSNQTFEFSFDFLKLDDYLLAAAVTPKDIDIKLVAQTSTLTSAQKSKATVERAAKLKQRFTKSSRVSH